MGELILLGVSGSLIGITIFYLLSSLLVKQWVRLDIYQLFLFMAATFLTAIVGEVVLGKLYYLVMGKPLWQYHVWPIHDGYTSALNFITWPVYGFYQYCLHYVLTAKKRQLRAYWLVGLASGLDGPILEILANGFFLLFYQTFYFYYLPNDMRHYTSIQVVPLYMIGGMILTLILKQLRERPPSWLYPIVFYAAGVAFIVTG
ncbi:hypothetical protein [Vibrio gazogenes]|uniref:Uncharacterized protein n=1 Tax=Vibrio gazogenes DSM 21264 = NBRC 103151 TaxID=1123492 RepID=A0A1M4SRK1_VIBGA|nr:hypothetical protein [Vibrio gazogenes]USP15931.1 hypothetical protein MKS89_16190 [Vibrio gazogenes]SHE34808.1 hypothetical protein SAMN02745781_00136 [Vibrio gazogenes DSM 21264] [Vibrio gazogenes DSM 21264 = NBRC 103151]